MTPDREPTRVPPSAPEEDADGVPVGPSPGFLLANRQDLDPRLAPGSPDQRPSSPTSAPEPPPSDSSSDLVDILRIVGWGLAVFAFLIFLGTSDRSGGLLIMLLVMLLTGLGLALVATSPERLKREQVIDRWDLLIPGAQGQGDAVVTATTFQIDQQRLPRVRYEHTDLSPSILGSLAGTTRPFLSVSQLGNRRLQPYRMHVNVRDYGDNLQASWFLAYHRSFFERVKPNPLVQLNLFDEQDLRAYVTAVHHCFTDSVVDLVSSLGQDTSRVDRSSKGFLGIS